MATNVQYILQLRDRFSDNMNNANQSISMFNTRIASASSTVTNSFSRSLDTSSRSAGRLSNSVDAAATRISDRLGTSLDRGTRSASRFTAQTETASTVVRNRFNRNIRNASRNIRTFVNRTNEASSGLGQFDKIIAGLAIFRLGKSILTAGIEMEKTRVAFATFLGDGEKANKLIEQLNEFANVTPFDNEQVIKSGRVLLSAGVAADDVTNRLKAIGDVAAGANVPLTELSAIYSKALNKGKVQAEELNQLAERGIPILQTFSDMFGVTTQQVLEMGSKGQLTSDLMAQAFQKMTSDGGIFFNLMEKQSETTGGRLSTLQGKLQLLAQNIGEELLPIVNSIVERFIRFTDYLSENRAVVVKVVKTVGALIGVFAAYKIAMKAAIIVTKAFRAIQLANPFGLLALGIVAAVAALSKFLSRSKKVVTEQKLMANVSTEVRKRLALEKVELNKLTTQLKASSGEQEKRADVIKQINDRYGEYLPALLTEKSTDEEIAAALEQVNKGMLEKIRLTVIQEKLTKAVEKQIDAEEALKGAILFNSKLQEKYNTSGVVGQYAIQQALLLSKGGLEENREEWQNASKAVKIYEKQLNQAVEKTTELAKPQKVKVDAKELDKQIKRELETKITAAAPKVINITYGDIVTTVTNQISNKGQIIPNIKAQIEKVITESLSDPIIQNQLT